MSAPPPPPPRREYTPSPKPTEEPTGWQAKMKARGGAWGKVAIDKGTIWSDKLGVRVNDIAEKRFGTEAFYPVTGDFPKEMDKCARILKAFTGMLSLLESRRKLMIQWKGLSKRKRQRRSMMARRRRRLLKC
jgi:hypothetical protein